jgi:hypothetical protein
MRSRTRNRRRRQDSHAREAELFARALELAAVEQRAFLERECAADRELAARVLALLASDRAPRTSLDLPALEHFAARRARERP